MPLIIPSHYDPRLSIRQTEIAIKFVKDNFEKLLAEELNLTRVSAPLFVLPNSGLNDNLNGVERPVSFDIKDTGDDVEIIHSLAKWKRLALKRYGFLKNEGLYTDMNAIRRDEELDNLHSIYVDQWDWEKIISVDNRNLETLYATVQRIYKVFKKIGSMVLNLHPVLKNYLPEEITFITAQELYDMYPALSPKERENEICRKYGAVFLSQIGQNLKSGKPHDGRAPDYDDWALNGDILLYYPLLNQAFEVSSMGIRVDSGTLKNQIVSSGFSERLSLPYHQSILNGELPHTIGGGLGQSRICMFLLNKAHIGEVQASIWPDDMVELCEKNNIQIL
ncbi:MAG: aspartate--ammonia ligase [Clostridiales bacterium]|jgi:aspartate--ammonia ligase|nr:aspartate--ammonia ligase [Clostridiales bacterium]